MRIQLEDIPTNAANDVIKGIHNKVGLETIIESHHNFDTRFMSTVDAFMERKGIKRKKVAIIVSQVMSPSHLYSLLNGNRRPNKREHVIAIGLALGLSVDEMNILLKDAGHRGLDAKRSSGDVVIIYGISHKMDLDDINDMLNETGSDYILFV